MAVAGAVKLEVIARAEENIRAVLKQSNNAIKRSAAELKKAGVAQSKMGAAVAKAVRGQSKFRTSLIASADGLSKLGSKLGNAKAAMGALAGALAVRAFRDFAIQGEKAANIAKRFGEQAGVTSGTLREMQEATSGLVEATDLQVVANRFARLGVPIETTTRLLELSTKAAIDQGREVLDVAKVVESSLKGRTTGLIDIGVNIDKITGLTKEYAAATGVAVSELDEMDRRLKVALPSALKALGEQFDAVDVKEFALGVQQADTAFGDLVSAMQVGAARIFESIEKTFQTASSRIANFKRESVQALRASEDAWNDFTANIKRRIADVSESLNAAATMGLSIFREQAIAWEEAGESQLLVEKQLARAKTANAQFNAEMVRSGIMRRENGEYLVQNEEALAVAQAKHQTALESTNAAERAHLKAVMQGRRAQAEADDATHAVLAEQARDRMARAGGELQATQDLRAAREHFNDVAKSGNADQLAAAEAAVETARKAETIAKRRAGSRGRSLKTAKDMTATIKEQVELLEHQNRVAEMTSERDQIRATFARKRLKIEEEIAKIDDEGLRTRAGVANFVSLEREEREALLGVGAKELEAAQAIARARFDVALAKESNESRRIEMSLVQEIAEISESSLSIEEKRLAIELARGEAKKALGDTERENRLMAAEEIAEGVGPAIGEAAGMLAEMDANLERLGHPKRYERISKGLAAVAAESQSIAKATAKFGMAVGKGSKEVAEGAAAALGAIQPAVAAFVEGTRDRALVMMAFELAMAVAEAAAQNYPAAVAHGLAAVMFGAMAGVSASQPTKAAPETAGGGGLVTPAGGGPTEQEAQSITVNLGPGMILGLPQELGRAISDQINSMAGTGMESTAF